MDTETDVEYMRITGRWWESDTLAEVSASVGMVAVQLGCSPQDAATVLRAHAAAHVQDHVDVAHDIVHRNLSFAP
jgi:hypothetical protein